MKFSKSGMEWMGAREKRPTVRIYPDTQNSYLLTSPPWNPPDLAKIDHPADTMTACSLFEEAVSFFNEGRSVSC
jgi:hypothetical protein